MKNSHISSWGCNRNLSRQNPSLQNYNSNFKNDLRKWCISWLGWGGKFSWHTRNKLWHQPTSQVVLITSWIQKQSKDKHDGSLIANVSSTVHKLLSSLNLATWSHTIEDHVVCDCVTVARKSKCQGRQLCWRYMPENLSFSDHRHNQHVLFT